MSNLSVLCRRFLLAVLAGLFCCAAVQQPALARPAASDAQPIPLMAYYYIWFDTQSWTHNKRDWPALGRYSSDDISVMRQHIRWAKEAGIDGFIVSWKSTHVLDKRLALLAEAAEEADFALWIIYQGLDYAREPLPVEHIAADLNLFVQQYATRPAFTHNGLPVVIWSGTWRFSPEDIASVAAPLKGRVQLLASERDVKGYARLAPYVDGDAYYWSSVNPDTFSGYEDKLQAMSNAVHAKGGLWVAPAAPGFDARMIGGERAVDRQDGAMLRRQLLAALKSAPDAVGLISWNEFTENSHIEPSANYGTRALQVVAELQKGQTPALLNFDSSAPGTAMLDDKTGISVLALAAALFALSLAVIIRRARHPSSQARH